MSDDPFGNGQTLQQSHARIMMDLSTTLTNNTEEVTMMTVKDLLPLTVKADDPVARTKQMLAKTVVSSSNPVEDNRWIIRQNSLMNQLGAQIMPAQSGTSFNARSIFGGL